MQLAAEPQVTKVLNNPERLRVHGAAPVSTGDDIITGKGSDGSGPEETGSSADHSRRAAQEARIRATTITVSGKGVTIGNEATRIEQ